VKHQLQKVNELFTARVEKAVTACSAKTLGQHVEHKQIEELNAANGPGSVLPILGVTVPKGDHAVFAAQDILFPDAPPVEVSTKIDDCFFPVADLFAVDNPFAGAISRHPHSLVNQNLQHLGSEDFGQGLVIEKVFGGLFSPQPRLLIDARPRHDNMNVGVIVQFSAVGMEHDGKSGFTSEFLVVSGKDFQGILDTGKQNGVNCFLVSPGNIPELFGKGESDQIIRSRQAFVQLFFNPLAAFMVLAMGTVPVAAGMGNVGMHSTVLVRTLYQHVGTVLLPASGHGL